MRQKPPPQQDRPTAVRVAVAGVVGVVVGVVVGAVAGRRYAPAAGWTAAAAVLVIWTWLVIARMSAEETEAHVTREDPARALTDSIVLIASDREPRRLRLDAPRRRGTAPATPRGRADRPPSPEYRRTSHPPGTGNATSSEVV